MNGNVWQPAHLTPERMDERRLAAATLLRQGRHSQAQISRQLGVHRVSVCRWTANPGPGWPRGLEARPSRDGPLASVRRPGPVWGGCWTGAPWRRALPLSAGPSSASLP
jgi:hypothetical protein